MTVKDFSSELDKNNTEHVEFFVNPTKTRQSGLYAKLRNFLQNMSAARGDRCPVTIVKEFLSCRPPEMRTTGSLYLSCVSNLSSQVFLQATTDEGEQAQQHDEGPNQRNHPWKINGKAFPTTALRKQ